VDIFRIILYIYIYVYIIYINLYIFLYKKFFTEMIEKMPARLQVK